MTQACVTTLSLWDFSLQLYARPAVADTCIELQDQQGINVNVFLWCVWLAARGQVLDSARLLSALQRIHTWDEQYIHPLRQLRRRMKAEFGSADLNIEAVRQHIKSAELLAEQQLQYWLDELTQSWGDSAQEPINCAKNIRCYFDLLGIADAQTERAIALFTGRECNE
jgi:uncharacterized protein (TIGR02444 family)